MKTSIPTYHVWKSPRDAQWYWRYRAANGETIASGEGYRRARNCLRAIELLQSSADCAIMLPERTTTGRRRRSRPRRRAKTRPDR